MAVEDCAQVDLEGSEPCSDVCTSAVLPGEDAAAARRRSRLTDTNWDLFRLFFSVARAGSVNRAARELGMSQPTLSRRLKELERYMGAPLFSISTA